MLKTVFVFCNKLHTYFIYLNIWIKINDFDKFWAEWNTSFLAMWAYEKKTVNTGTHIFYNLFRKIFFIV